MDINNLNKNQIEQLAKCRLAIDALQKASDKKTRKWATAFISEDKALEKRVATLTDEEFFALIEECHAAETAAEEEENRIFYAMIAEFDEATKKMLKRIIDEPLEISFTQNGKELYLELDLGDCSAKGGILFSDWSLDPKLIGKGMYFENSRLEKRGSEYVLKIEAFMLESDETPSFELCFKKAKAVVTVCRCDHGLWFFIGTPWDNLSAMARTIYRKHERLGDSYLNEKEKELLPLLYELGSFGLFPRGKYPLFKKLLAEHGHLKLLPILKAMENAALSDKKRQKALKKLLHTLCDADCEGLWRTLYNRIRETQKEYPSYINEEAAAKVRAAIIKELYALGYEGEYPAFVKRDDRKGTASHIYCSEYEAGDGVAVCFLCGAEILDKGKVPTDIYTCMFREDGKRFFKSHTYQNEDGEHSNNALKTACRIADKMARLEKLTKEERKAIGQNLDIDWKSYIVLFLTAGIFFGVAFTLLFAIFAVIDEGSLSVLNDVYWLKMLAQTSISFGLLSGTALFALLWLGSRK